MLFRYIATGYAIFAAVWFMSVFVIIAVDGDPDRWGKWVLGGALFLAGSLLMAGMGETLWHLWGNNG